MHRIFSKLLCQAEGARVDQAGVGAVAGGGEAGEEGRGAGQDDPGKDAHRGVGEVTFSNMALLASSTSGHSLTSFFSAQRREVLERLQAEQAEMLDHERTKREEFESVQVSDFI